MQSSHSSLGNSVTEYPSEGPEASSTHKSTTIEQVKTYKRELACLLLALLGVTGYLALSDAQAMLIFDKLRWPIFTFVAGAFGLDAVSKQWGSR